MLRFLFWILALSVGWSPWGWLIPRNGNHQPFSNSTPLSRVELNSIDRPGTG